MSAITPKSSLSALAFAAALAFVLPISQAAWAGDGHDHEQGPSETDARKKETSENAVTETEAGHDDDKALKLSQTQRELAGIRVETIQTTGFDLSAVATASLVVDRDRTITLAPQLEVRVLERHVVPGQEVKQGEPLLTLGGAAIAQAQADYINAANEWSRISRMSDGAVSQSQKQQTRVDFELKRAILESIKMTEAQIKALGAAPESIGSFKLLAPISGRVQQDVASRGQVLAAGSPLMQLTDESFLWVEAELTPQQSRGLAMDGEARLSVSGKWLKAKVIGRSHELNSITRTEKVLLSMANPGHEVHAGEFAELYLPQRGAAAGSGSTDSTGIVLPDSALSRSADGDWQVFVEDADGFEAVEVEIEARARGLNLVKGINPGQNVVMSGAFFLASELAKSGFDIHNH
ncbi:efflux RND transporter periplasmic adaptor subunit [Shewanella sp. JM162201]|uniref:Efflux RND transporter periplasmic adaptor subunit n=1 Tax=Shewanella jiangmenensis TaxID=2837387 RepID=A0ABS5V7K6_9GAMM|nr:efflux RND transporter periplasmic adaptor subunit [Shewanella jiangmenensis]MBT1446403.1 efflux RND transporter periplasmic adaptor subunit [Shewanella jiangmenensis]